MAWNPLSWKWTRKPRTRKPLRFRPQLEALERRVVLDGFTSSGVLMEWHSWWGVVATFTPLPGNPTSVTINWGDGTSSSGEIAGGNPAAIWGGHTYLEQGTYTATVIIDYQGTGTGTSISEEQTVTATMIVPDAPLTATGLGLTTFEESNMPPSTVATFHDDDPDSGSEYVVNIDWGDGNQSLGWAVPIGDNQYAALGTHRYQEDRVYHTITKIYDLDADGTGTSSATALGQIIAADVYGIPFATETNVSFGQVVGVVYGVQSSPGFPGYSALINWGDGQTTAGSVVWNTNLSRFDVAGGHVYHQQGPHPLLIQVTDLATQSQTVIGDVGIPIDPHDHQDLQTVPGMGWSGTSL
ncbi:MAG TPA: hypothetical protein VGY66_03825, partial [Gemmataceae bacterium]|nr:hypothetical protein [Gemmataceae bacterium]